MAWLELRVQAELSRVHEVEEALFAAGALSVTASDAADSPIFEPDRDNPPVWPRTRLIGLFEADTDKTEVEQVLLASGSAPGQQVAWEILEDRNWETEWAKHFKPMHFGSNFWVFSEPVDEPGAQTLLLDPGLAFGTGTHATTALCLEWLVQHPPAGEEVIDFGCGSGVLGIAALLLGASRCTFVDIDEQALQATRNNLRKNQLDPASYPLLKAPLDKPVPAAQRVIANILSEPLIQLSDELCGCLSPGGLICLSGILDHQVDAVSQAYSRHLHRIEITGRDEWRCLSGHKRPDL